MITKIRAYIKNHPRVAWILCGTVFVIAALILLQYLYQSFAPPPPLEGETPQTGGLSTIFLALMIFFIFVLLVGGIIAAFWWIYKKTKEEFPT
jgi:uncharacterized membrane protein